MTNPAALDEALEWVRAEKEIFDDLGLEPVCGHHMAALCEAARRYSAIVKAVEGGEKALVYTKATTAMMSDGAKVLNRTVGANPSDFFYGTAEWASDCYEAMIAASGIDALIKGD